MKFGMHIHVPLMMDCYHFELGCDGEGRQKRGTTMENRLMSYRQVTRVVYRQVCEQLRS